MTPFIVNRYHHLSAKDKVFRQSLEACLPYLAGKTDQPPVPVENLIEPELAAVAALVSWSNGDVTVPLAELHEDHTGYNGAAFAREYRQQKYSAQRE